MRVQKSKKPKEFKYARAFALLLPLNPQGFLLVQSNEIVIHTIFHLFE